MSKRSFLFSSFKPVSVHQVSSVFTPGNFLGFALVNRPRTTRINTGFTVEISTVGTQLSYSNFDYVGQEPHFWQLPGAYQGDKVRKHSRETGNGNALSAILKRSGRNNVLKENDDLEFFKCV